MCSNQKNVLITKNQSEILKFCFAMMILLHHILQKSHGWSHLYSNQFGYLAVAGFFLCSGYGVKKSLMKNEHYLDGFLVKRITKIYTPFLIASLVYILVGWAEGKAYTSIQILDSLIGGYTIVNFSWFIFEVIIFYVMFYLAERYCAKYSGFVITILTVILIAAMRNMDMRSYWYVSSLAFPMGIICASKEQHILKIAKNPIAWGTIPIFIACYMEQENEYLKIASAVAFVCMILMILLYVKISENMFRRVREYSMEMYLLQGLFVYGMREISIYSDMLYLLCVLVSTTTAAFLFKLIRKSVCRIPIIWKSNRKKVRFDFKISNIG